MRKGLDLKDHINETRVFIERIIVAVCVIFLLLAIILWRLFYLQVVNQEHYATLSEKNRINVQAIAPSRGRIFDRNGKVLARNIASYNLEIIPERIKDIDKLVKELETIVTVSAWERDNFYKLLRRKHGFNSIPLASQLSDEDVARFSVNRHRFPGAELVVRLSREYPYAESASHVVGYVGRIDAKELSKIDRSSYAGLVQIGKRGIEKYYEDLLRGKPGLLQIEVNVQGRKIREVSGEQAVSGSDIYLTLDIELQQQAAQALAGFRGAVVAIEPATGDILAMVSQPDFDPNIFTRGLDRKQLKAIYAASDQPLFNRALQGQYPPGSTVKPFIGLAGLEHGVISASDQTFCPGWYRLEGVDHKYRDWKRRGHGITALSKAIIESCDIYFYDLAYNLGIDRMHDFMQQFGFGIRTQIDMPVEAQGIMPSRQWKREHKNQPWYHGETLITGIGQGFTLTTPLQLATATAVLALQGQRVQPRMLRAIQQGAQRIMQQPYYLPPVKLKKPQHWALMSQAMKQVVTSRRGTAHNISKGLRYDIAAKTGTAQVISLKQDDDAEPNKKTIVNEKHKDHAIFIAYAPLLQPTIAIAVIVENGGGGGSVAAPIARKILDAYLNRS